MVPQQRRALHHMQGILCAFVLLINQSLWWDHQVSSAALCMENGDIMQDGRAGAALYPPPRLSPS